ncbi:MAG: hypothetical protein ABSB89_05180 [Candidatus Bathyarchaeia archaeon]|jgi:hypothetical protein
MSEKENPLFRGKTEKEIDEFLRLEGELIVELDALSPPMKRAILDNLRQIAKLPPWMQRILLDDINTAAVNRIGIMVTIIQTQKQNEQHPTFRMARDDARERKKE